MKIIFDRELHTPIQRYKQGICYNIEDETELDRIAQFADVIKMQQLGLDTEFVVTAKINYKGIY